jgi:hypothetical protein
VNARKPPVGEPEISVLVSWFDEEPRLLAEAVESVAWADRLVCADGQYSLFHDRRDRSPRSQYDAIREAASSRGLRCRIYAVPPCSEPAKRSHMFAVAGSSGWAIVVDADEVVERVDVAGLRRLLSSTACDVATVEMRQRVNGEELFWRARRIFRMLPGLRIVDAHYEVRVGARRLAGAEDRKPWLEPCEAAPLVLRHRRDDRTLGRRRAQAAYYRKRDAAGIERLP